MHILIDIGIVGILAFCAWQGYKRGIIGSVIAVIFIVVAIYGGNLVANTYSDEFTGMFRPFISGYLDSVEVQTANELVPEAMQGLSTEDMLRLDPGLEPHLVQEIFMELGIYETRAERLTYRYLEYRTQELSINRALTNVMVYAFCYLIVFTIAFLLILIALTVIYNIIHLSFRLPGIKLVDEIGGGVLGLVQGLMLVWMLGWLLGYTGILLPEGLLTRTGILEFFVRANPMTNFINL